MKLILGVFEIADLKYQLSIGQFIDSHQFFENTKNVHFYFKDTKKYHYLMISREN